MARKPARRTRSVSRKDTSGIIPRLIKALSNSASVTGNFWRREWFSTRRLAGNCATEDCEDRVHRLPPRRNPRARESRGKPALGFPTDSSCARARRRHFLKFESFDGASTRAVRQTQQKTWQREAEVSGLRDGAQFIPVRPHVDTTRRDEGRMGVPGKQREAAEQFDVGVGRAERIETEYTVPLAGVQQGVGTGRLQIRGVKKTRRPDPPL